MNEKILFTSDWHINKDSWGRDRRDEIYSSLRQLAVAAATRNVQHVVVGGDVFESFRYPGRENIQFASSLFRLFLDIPDLKNFIIVEGNHDWNDMGVWSDMCMYDHFHIVEEPSFMDVGCGNFIFVPHLRKHQIKNGLDTVLSPSVPTNGKDSVLIAHMALEGTVPEISEPVMTKECLGMYPSLTSAYFGHIHTVNQHDVNGIPCRYIGTPTRLSFAEEKNPVGGWVGDFKGHAERVNVSAPELITVRGKNTKDIISQLSEIPIEDPKDTMNPYIRVVVDGAVPVLEEELASFCPNQATSLVKIQQKEEAEREDSMMVGDVFEMNAVPITNVVFSISELWKDFLKSKLGEKHKDLPHYEDLGTALLSGSSEEEIWNSMTHNERCALKKGMEKTQGKEHAQHKDIPIDESAEEKPQEKVGELDCSSQDFDMTLFGL